MFFGLLRLRFLSRKRSRKEVSSIFLCLFFNGDCFLFYEFCDKYEKNNLPYVYSDFTTLRKLLLRSFASTAAIVVLWDLLDEFKIPNISEIVSLGILLFFVYLLFQTLILLYSSKNKDTLLKILPSIGLLLVIKLTEVFRYFEGSKIMEPIHTFHYYFLILSPIILNECISMISSDIQKTQNKFLLDDSTKNETDSPRDSIQEKRSLLEDLNIEKVESKLAELMQNEKVHLDEELRLPSLASEMGLSVHHLSAFLNEHMGMNFNTFINHHRVKEAKVMLLEEPDRSILSIGMAVGFSSSSAFHRAFLKETKKSPKAFREENLPNYKSKEDEMESLDPRYSHSI
ncbi:DNA-binding helix-turn-helix protein [Leptospira interrogans serovar Pyrogenes str. 200701872]|uniref:DNA-binding helix-turn-helix protein n=2 Tax=Leptospira interrogans TaxID=173 RepID=M6ZSU3_LEPIR|nr:DNA-binding helix-turn-helix protein [Leptospira interrogans serovar Pyrogenes str. 200701872]